MFISAQHLAYTIQNHGLLFNDVNFTLQKGAKAAIVGNNGTGKTTLLKIIAGQEKHYTGQLQATGSLYYVPQHYGQFDHLTVAAALGIAPLLTALQAVENGATDQHYYDLLEHHWDIVARCEEAFARWDITIALQQPLHQLSGGMKTRLFLSGIDILNPAIVLLDEPTNHLDERARTQLYEWMAHTNRTLLLTSHDRTLLRLCDPIWELQAGGIRVYGGNYDFYTAQKDTETAAREHKLAYHEKALKEAKQKQQQAMERKDQANAQARKNSQRGGSPKILLNARKNVAEGSTAKLKQVHDAKVSELRVNMQEAAAMVKMQRVMKAYFDHPAIPPGKVLVQATAVNYAYNETGQLLWPHPVTLTIRGGTRMAIAGNNGSGKTTLLNLLRGALAPSQGSISISRCNLLLLDQEYSLVNRSGTVLQQALAFNNARLEEAMVHLSLANFYSCPIAGTNPAPCSAVGKCCGSRFAAWCCKTRRRILFSWMSR